MKKELVEALKIIDTKEWKEIEVEYGITKLNVVAPPNYQEITMKKVNVISEPREEIKKAIEQPIGSKKLEEIVKDKKKKINEIIAAITVSDITRPVPYKGKEGILLPLLTKLENIGIKRENIKIIIGNGMHRVTTKEEKIQMFSEEVVSNYQIIDHNCEDKEMLIDIGTTPSGTKVYVNKYFAMADLKIATGLIESHFMAGVSGGRKAICPGLVDLQTIQKFHSPAFLESPYATNLVLENNPCDKEAKEIARKVGVDFLLNVTLDKDMKLTGIFAGDLIKAHNKGVEKLKSYVEVTIEQEFDIVLTNSGYVGRDHYQTAKCAVAAIEAIKKDGIMIIVANNCDKEPIGSKEYRTLIHLLKVQGATGYLSLINSKEWKFMKDQWQPQMWARVFKKILPQNLFYITGDIKKEEFAILPGRSGYEFLENDDLKDIAALKKMLQNAIIYAVYNYKMKGVDNPTFVFIKEGPYVIPKIKQ